MIFIELFPATSLKSKSNHRYSKQLDYFIHSAIICLI